MSHPTVRLLTVLELLLAYPRITGAELAERLELDPRTVWRYIAMLQEWVFPSWRSVGAMAPIG
jgi:predicted DNA-binding transcriptional regulator YafY